MTQEEKAKAYDEALKRAREWHNDPHITIGLKGNLEDIFPELKESEDEKIRKWLISQLKIKSDDTNFDLNIMIDKAISWLEKQGGQKFAWSEEDEEILRTIISDGLRGAEFDMLQINWLKSLKQRIGWKPSEEQMEALYEETQKSDRIRDDRIVSLYDDLKKLKGE